MHILVVTSLIMFLIACILIVGCLFSKRYRIAIYKLAGILPVSEVVFKYEMERLIKSREGGVVYNVFMSTILLTLLLALATGYGAQMNGDVRVIVCVLLIPFLLIHLFLLSGELFFASNAPLYDLIYTEYKQSIAHFSLVLWILLVTIAFIAPFIYTILFDMCNDGVSSVLIILISLGFSFLLYQAIYKTICNKKLKKIFAGGIFLLFFVIFIVLSNIAGARRLTSEDLFSYQLFHTLNHNNELIKKEASRIIDILHHNEVILKKLMNVVSMDVVSIDL